MIDQIFRMGRVPGISSGSGPKPKHDLFGPPSHDAVGDLRNVQIGTLRGKPFTNGSIVDKVVGRKRSTKIVW